MEPPPPPWSSAFAKRPVDLFLGHPDVPLGHQGSHLERSGPARSSHARPRLPLAWRAATVSVISDGTAPGPADILPPCRVQPGRAIEDRHRALGVQHAVVLGYLRHRQDAGDAVAGQVADLGAGAVRAELDAAPSATRPIMA